MQRRQYTFRALWASVVATFILLLFLSRQQTQYRQNYYTPESTPRSADILDDINNSTFGFEKIFVVGLPDRTDRRDGMALAAALTNIEFEFIDGVRGQDISDKALPSRKGLQRPSAGAIGAWRAHMNAIQEIVRRNLSSALILEDDIDWDVRIRQQLRDFGRSTQALTQPLASYPNLYADPTYPSGGPLGADDEDSFPELYLESLPATLQPQISPYGDDWDILWVGHCGMQFILSPQHSAPRGRVLHHNDETCAESRYLWSLAEPFTLKENYPDHTRAVHHIQEGVCSLAYAVSQRGARRLLYDVGLAPVDDAFDISLQNHCDGANGHKRYGPCLGIQPGIFQHHVSAGPRKALSDIGEKGEEWVDHSSTDWIRWSTRINAEVLMDGRDNFWDALPNSDNP